MKCISIINLTVLLILILTSVYGEDQSYLNDLPPLYKFDDYDACLTQKPHNSTPIYAMVFAEIKAKNSSQLWQQIKQHYMEYPYRFRRDRLFFGVCIERCKNLTESIENFELTDNDIVKNEISDYFAKVHKRSLDIKCREEYDKLIHKCLNQEFQEKYDLNLRTFLEYCEESKVVEGDEKGNIFKDPLEILFFTIMSLIILLNISSTLYDLWLKLQQPEEKQTNEFYKINPQQKADKLLTSFSLSRNYYRLIQPYSLGIGKDFRFLDGYRSICMLIALVGHTIITEFQHVANPQYFELSSKNENILWIFNTTMNIETFFTISGVLLLIKCHHGRYVTPQTSWKKLFSKYIELMINRFLRLFPTTALLLLVNATILYRLQDGPFWRHITEPLRVFARENGWKNLLMINNFSNKESSGFHTWYLGTDWQLYAFYLMITLIVYKYPNYKKPIYSTLAILSFVIPFSISYFLKLQPCFILKPESYRYTFILNTDVFLKIYIQFYTNLFGYLIGIICAEIYLKYTHKLEVRKFVAKQIWSKVALCLLPIIAFVICWSGALLDLKEPSIWSALYAGVHRNLWLIFICGIPLILMTCNCGWLAYDLCCLPIFRILSRLSFQVFIWHMTIIYMINGYQRQPYYVNNFYILTQFLITYCAAHILALFFTLFVEYPIAQFVQIMQTKKNDKNIKKS